ncbi:hypothetical protein EON80_19250, partial [bacterium]
RQLRAHLRSQHNDRPFYAGNVLDSLSKTSVRVIEAAQAAMRDSFCGQISTTHLLLGLLAPPENSAVTTLRAAGVDIEAFKDAARAMLTSDGQIATPQKKFAPTVKRAIERAKDESIKNGFTSISPAHLLVALLPRPASVAEKFSYGAAQDPLEKFWANWPVDAILHHYNSLQERERELIEIPILDATERTKKIVERGYQEMLAHSGSRISTAHLLLGILKEEDTVAIELLQGAGCDIALLQSSAEDLAFQEPSQQIPAREYTEGAKRAMRDANLMAYVQGFKFIDSSQVLTGLMAPSEGEDSVAHLWTQQQAVAVFDAVRSVSIRPESVETRPQSLDDALRNRIIKCALFNIGVGFLCMATIASNSNGEPAGQAVTFFSMYYGLTTGVGAAISFLRKGPALLKATWCSFFFGFLSGLLLAGILRIGQ